MGMPDGIGVIDTMLGIPEPGHKERWYDFLKPNLRDKESETFAFPAQYMFKDVPKEPEDMSDADAIAFTIAASFALVAMSRTKLMSILRLSLGKRLR